jgi:hypothetical protein
MQPSYAPERRHRGLIAEQCLSKLILAALRDYSDPIDPDRLRRVREPVSRSKSGVQGDRGDLTGNYIPEATGAKCDGVVAPQQTAAHRLPLDREDNEIQPDRSDRWMPGHFPAVPSLVYASQQADAVPVPSTAGTLPDIASP